MAKRLTHTRRDFDMKSHDPMQINARYDVDTKSVRPVGTPASTTTVEGTIIGIAKCDVADIVISTSGNAIYGSKGTEQAQVIAQVDELPTAAVEIDGGLMLTSHLSGESPLLLNVDRASGETEISSPLPRHGAPRLVRIDDTPIMASLPSRTLTGSYGRSETTLNPADTAVVTSDYIEAYTTAIDRARVRGRFLQPVIARLSARDRSGRLLYRSAPVMIAPASGAALLKVERNISGDSLNQVAATTMSATPFSIGVVFPTEYPQQWLTRVAAIEVETTVQLHPVNFNLPASGHINNPASASPTLFVSAPGCDTTLSAPASDTSYLRSRVEAILDSGDKAFSIARSISCNQGVIPTSVTGIFHFGSPSCKAEITALTSLTAPAEKDFGTIEPWLLNYPHTFSAGCGVRSGDTILWGDITVKRFQGYGVAEQCITPAAESVATPTTSIITLADGSLLVDSVTESSAIPGEISPLLTYPHPSAVKISILKGTRMYEAPLRPTPSGKLSYFLASDLRPVTATTSIEMHIVPPSSVITERFPGVVALARSGNELYILSTTTVASQSVTSLVPQLRAGSSLDITRRHFYAFTRSGIYTITAAGAKLTLSSSLLDHRPVMTGSCVTRAADCFLAVAGQDLLKISGNKVVTVLSNVGPCSIGYCNRYNEIWLVSEADDPTMIYNPSIGYGYYRTDVYPESMIATGDSLLLHLPDGSLLDTACELPQPKRVHLTYRHNLPRAESVTAFGIRLIGTSVVGTIALAADNGIHSPDGAYRVVSFDVSGQPARPLEARVISHPFRYITLEIDATLSADSRLEGAWIATKITSK